jgi:coenzyme F420-dependent glucose-6-phosphate dehydrogenase
MQISYHVSHEQFSPRELLSLVTAAEVAGFDAAFASDHLNPWTRAQGHSGHLWCWLGAALQATERMTFSCITIPLGLRYHPALIAQAVGTLSQMFPGRLPWVAFGTGEALNESVVHGSWPVPSERKRLLEEGAEIVRLLLAGHTVTRSGAIQIANGRIWSRGEPTPALMGAAMSNETAAWVGTWADGLLTLGSVSRDLHSTVAAFRTTGGSKPVHMKVDLSWAPDEQQALRQAHEQWYVHRLPRDQLHVLRTPEQFEEAARDVRPEEMRESVLISADLDRHVEWLRERMAQGPASLDLHNVGKNQQEFIEAFGSYVLPRLR